MLSLNKYISPGWVPLPWKRRFPRIHLALIALFMSLVCLLTLEAATAGAYTVEKHDDAVTGQFVISPTKVELDMKPGESAARDIVVANRTGTTLTIEFSMEDFEGSSDPSQATVFLGEEDGAWGARRWLEPEISSIVLKHGETLTFRTRITVPKNAEPGGRYAALFASSTYEGQDEQGSAINITSRVGSLFLIRVAGQINEDGNLGKPEVPSLSEYGPINIGLVFNNLGNIHLKPSGRVLVTNFLGQTVAEIPVPEWVVLPESSRRNEVTWDSHYLFGRYTARAEIGYDGNGQPIVATTTFWVIPWKIVLAIAVGVILLIAFVAWAVRRRRGERLEPDDEFGDSHSAQAAGAGADEDRLAGSQRSVATAPSALKLVKLSDLFPSIGDNSIVDLSDAGTQKLIRDLIGQQVDLARAFILDGRMDEARGELMEARTAAQRISLLAEIGMIDDMLLQIQD